MPDGTAAPAAQATVPGNAPPPSHGQQQLPSPAILAALLVRQALKGALGSLDRSTGHPYASLVTVATEPDGAPLLLISHLALHTRNLEADPRASLMIDGTAADGDPMAGGRVTLIGRCAPTESTTAPRRFLARHPSASVYAGFADFRFYRFDVERAHFIGGFGRIVDLQPATILCSAAHVDALAAAEAELIAKLNAGYSQAVARIAAARGSGAGIDGWRISGLDGDGFDLVGGSSTTLRVPFLARVTTPEAAVLGFEQLVCEAGPTL